MWRIIKDENGKPVLQQWVVPAGPHAMGGWLNVAEGEAEILQLAGAVCEWAEEEG